MMRVGDNAPPSAKSKKERMRFELMTDRWVAVSIAIYRSTTELPLRFMFGFRVYLYDN